MSIKAIALWSTVLNLLFVCVVEADDAGFTDDRAARDRQ